MLVPVETPQLVAQPLFYDATASVSTFFLCFCPCRWGANIYYLYFYWKLKMEVLCIFCFWSFDKLVISQAAQSFWLLSCSEYRDDLIFVALNRKKKWLWFSVEEKPVLEDIHSFKQEQVFNYYNSRPFLILTEIRLTFRSAATLCLFGRKCRRIFQHTQPKHVSWLLSGSCIHVLSQCIMTGCYQTLALNIHIWKALKHFCIVISTRLFCGFVKGK